MNNDNILIELENWLIDKYVNCNKKNRCEECQSFAYNNCLNKLRNLNK